MWGSVTPTDGPSFQPGEWSRRGPASHPIAQLGGSSLTADPDSGPLRRARPARGLPANWGMIRGKTPRIRRYSGPAHHLRFVSRVDGLWGAASDSTHHFTTNGINMTSIKSALERRLAERQEGRGLLAHRASRRRHHHRHPRRDRDSDLHRCAELGEGLGGQGRPDQRQDRHRRVRDGQPGRCDPARAT